uniref:RING-type domain-containing protein n=1 Tax=Ananas comosus var. bracteatus TaxID=296719 RepID=A0A6V7NFU4_ANACO|nr:unnamed protein product [Ananas comosus var. bracteatus]
MSSSDSSWAASTLPDSPAPAAAAAAAAAAAGVGLGYGIAIAVGILVLVSTIMLASYLCVRAKGTSSSSPPRPPHSPPPPPPFTHHIRNGGGGGARRRRHRRLLPEIRMRRGEGRGGGGGGDVRDMSGGVRGREAVRRGTECGHGFHAGCAERWLRVSAACPLCRSSPSPSPAATTPAATPLSELIPLALHAR